MKTTIDFLNAVKAANGFTSDYQLAKFLGVTQQTVSVYMLKKSYLGDETAIKVAEALKIDPAQVIASVHYERAKKAEEKAVWKGILERLGGIAAGVVIGITLINYAPIILADYDNIIAVENIHYTKC